MSDETPPAEPTDTPPAQAKSEEPAPATESTAAAAEDAPASEESQPHVIRKPRHRSGRGRQRQGKRPAGPPGQGGRPGGQGQGQRGGGGGHKQVIQRASQVPIDKAAVHLKLSEPGSTVARCLTTCHLAQPDSIELDTKNNTYRCIRCSKRGNVIDLAREELGVTPRRAAEILLNLDSDAAGKAVAMKKEYTVNSALRKQADADTFQQPVIHLTAQAFNQIRTKKHARKEDSENQASPTLAAPSVDRSEVFKSGLTHRIYTSFYRQLSFISRLPLGLQIFTDRKINPSTLDDAGVRFISDYHRVDENLRKEFGEDNLRAAGLFGPLSGEDGNVKMGLSFYFHKIVFAFRSGRNVSFLSVRRMDNQDPEWLHTSPVFSLLYNIEDLRHSKPGESVLLTNGILNTLTLKDRGYAAVGMTGNRGFRKDWTEMFKDRDVILAFDSSDEGRRSFRQAAKHLKALDTQPRLGEYAKLAKKKRATDDLPRLGERPEEEEPFWKQGGSLADTSDASTQS